MTDPNRPPLSPAAQAVLEASHEAWVTKDDPISIAAAVLRAAADQLLMRPDVERSEYSTLMRLLDRQFRAIAAELEGRHA